MDEFDHEWVTELIFSVDVETQAILDVTGDVEACLGLNPELLVGLPLFASVHRDDISDAQAAFDRVVAEGRATWEGRVQRLDGVFVRYGWEGRLGLDRTTIYARSRDVDVVRAEKSKFRVYERLAEQTVDLLIVVNDEGRIVEANRAVAEAHGVNSDEVIGSLLLDYVTPEGQAVLQDMPRRLMQGESVMSFRVPALDSSGVEMIMEGTATFDSLTKRWYVVERNVTERVAREQELEITQRFFDLSSSQLLLIDDEDRVVRANRSFLSLTAWELDDVIGSDVLDALRFTGGSNLRASIAGVRRGEAQDPCEIRIRVDGELLVVDVQLSAAADGGAVYLNCRNVTEERSLRAELERRASRDSLTKLANRTSLLEAIESDLRSGELVAMMMLDLDGFKRINDSLGHAAGDALLIGIAQRLEQQTRGTDVVARLGGDEFVILLRGIPDSATLELVCQKIGRAFERPFDVLGRPVEVTASIGAVTGDRVSHSHEELLHQADIAAYAAKRNGTDCYYLFDDELRDQEEFRSAVEEHLRRVLRAPDLDLNVVELCGAGGNTVGLGVIAPAIAESGQRRWKGEALDVATDLGLLGPISARMTDEAVKRLSPWLQANPQSFLEVVFSINEISMAGFVEMLLERLDTHGVDPRQFVVSMSRSREGGSAAVDPEAIAQLRDAGVRVALADSRADAATLSAIASIGLDRIDVDLLRLASSAEESIERLVADTVFEAAGRLGIEVVVDASFTPDVVDIGSLFTNCVPVPISMGKPVSAEEFLDRANGSVEERDVVLEEQAADA